MKDVESLAGSFQPFRSFFHHLGKTEDFVSAPIMAGESLGAQYMDIEKIKRNCKFFSRWRKLHL